jgi:hypothetical protein
MGTRHLIAVMADGKYKIAQYGQWDGYPEGQGVTALEFLRTATNRKRLKAALKHCVWVTEAEIAATMKKLKVDEWMNEEQAAIYHSTYPLFSRNHGAEILRMVATTPKKARPIRLYDSTSFAGDSLYCEWAYVVDFDKETFEVYKGFNESPLDKDERFAHLPEDTDQAWKPVRLVKSFRLSRLPAPASFLKSIKKLTQTDDE